MEQLNLLLELCQSKCTLVDEASASDALKFDHVTVVRGFACSYKLCHLQELALHCTNVDILKESFTNWGEEQSNVEFPATQLLTALMPTKSVNDVDSWFNSAIAPVEMVADPVLLVATGNCITGFHLDNKPLTEVVASLLRGRKLWIFATRESKSAALLVKRSENTQLQQFIEDMVYGRFKDLLYCLQEPGDTICFPARTVHFVLSVTVDNGWNCLLSHNIRHSEEEAKVLETKALNRCSAQSSRNVQGKRTKRSGLTKKRFTSRRRVQSS